MRLAHGKARFGKVNAGPGIGIEIFYETLRIGIGVSRSFSNDSKP